MEMKPKVEGFSIREYVSRMRSVNVVKCWPFDDDDVDDDEGTRVVASNLLPPITVKKFIYWFDELQSNLHTSNDIENSSKRVDDDQDKGEPSSFIKPNDDDDDLKVKSLLRGKANKAPKKSRSIVDIFAVAPEVIEREQPVISSRDEVEDTNNYSSTRHHQQQQQQHEDLSSSRDHHLEEINRWGLKRKRTTNNNANNKKKINKEKNVLSKLKKLIKKKKHHNIKLVDHGDDDDDKISDLLLVLPPHDHKENCSTSKLRDEQDKTIGNQSSSRTRDSKKDTRGRVPTRKKKPKLQHIDADKKKMTCKAVQSTFQHPENPTPAGILKKHIFLTKKSKNDMLQEAIQVDHRYGKQTADKHVTFLQTDDILGRNFGSINENFVGLPLNSQGELIRYDSSSSAPSANSDYRRISSSKEQLNLFPMESYSKEKCTVFDRSRLGITESQSNRGKTILDYAENNGVQKSHGNEKIPSTLRLMGKEFKVGGTGSDEYDDGHIWKDKHVIDDHHANTNGLSLGRMTNNLFSPSEFTVNHRPERMYTFPIVDGQTSLTLQNGFVPREINPFEKYQTNPFENLRPNPSYAVYNNECLFQQPFTSGYKSQDPYPGFSSNIDNVQLKHNENFVTGPRSSAIRFPFMHPDVQGHVQSSWSRGSLVNQHPPFFYASEMATVPRTDYQNLGVNYQNFGPSTFQRAPVICYPEVVQISSLQKRSRNGATII